jgi:hypothetical protein
VLLLLNPIKSHGRVKKSEIVTRTNGPYPLSSVNQRRTDNRTAKRKSIKGQTTIYKTYK